MQHDITEVQMALRDVRFPASVAEIVASARHRGTDQAVLESLTMLPQQQYDDADAVIATLEDQIA